MALKLTCPACTAAFALAKDVRGKKAFCPNCGASLIVTRGGAAKRDEVRPTALPAPSARNRLALLLIAVLGLGLLGGFVVTVVLLLGDRPDAGGQANNDHALLADRSDSPAKQNNLPEKEFASLADDGGPRVVGRKVQPNNGDTPRVAGLMAIPVKLPAPFRTQLPCMLWADAKGSAFLVLEEGSGVLRRISFPDLQVTKQKEFDRKFTWMSASAEGLVLSEPDPGKIWLIDAASFEVKTRIDVPHLQRAASAPGLSLAVAGCGSPYPYRAYVVDLVKKTIAPDNNPANAKAEWCGHPAVTPDGASVFFRYRFEGISRFSFKGGKLTYEDNNENHDRPPHYLAPKTTVELDDLRNKPISTGITFSSDSKLVCFPSLLGNIDVLAHEKITTAIYPIDTFARRHCILELGPNPQAVCFDLKTGCIYAQNNAYELIVFTLHGVKKKEYRLGRQPPESVTQFLVHPAGGRLIMLTRQAVYAIDVPREK